MSREVLDGDAEADLSAQPDPSAQTDLSAQPDLDVGAGARRLERWPLGGSRTTAAAVAALLLAVLAAVAGSSLGESRARSVLTAQQLAQLRIAVHLEGQPGGPTTTENGRVLVPLSLTLLGSQPVVVTGLTTRFGVLRLQEEVDLPAGKVVYAGLATVVPDCTLPTYVSPDLYQGATATVLPLAGGPPRQVPVIFGDSPDALGATLMFPCTATAQVPDVVVTAMTAHPDGTLSLTLRNLGTEPVSFDFPGPLDAMRVLSVRGPALPLTVPATGIDVVVRLRFVPHSCDDPAGADLVPDTARLYPSIEGNLVDWDSAKAAAAVAAAVTLACR